MKVLIDMNLTPAWLGFLRGHGVEAVHWADVGDPRATDTAIMSWARERRHLVFTHDLDFSALLAHTQATGPSVLQVRTQEPLPEAIGVDVLGVLRDHAEDFERGAIVTIDKIGARIRVLPIGSPSGTP